MKHPMWRTFALVAAAAWGTTAFANSLYQLVVTDQPSPRPGEVLQVLEPTRLSTKCLPMAFRMNSTIDPIPNVFNGETLPLAEAAAGIRAAMKAWTDIPTSYVDLRLEGTVSNPVPPSFDFVNEVSFVTPPVAGGIAAFTRIYTFPADVTVASGDDLDGDGDADVASIPTCRDVDGDGDHEMPAGAYGAGTIFEADIVFTRTAQFLVAPAALNDPARVDFDISDLVGVAAHELGHAFGLNHTMITEIGGTQGTGSTMASSFFGGIGARMALRSLSEEDEAWASYIHPEGSARSGPAALQRGDVAFGDRYSIVSGEVRNAQDLPLVGPSVFARNYRNELVSSSIVGHVQFSFNPATGFFNFLPPASGVIDGKYELPVPKGIYEIGIEGVDFTPYPQPFAGIDFNRYCGLTGWLTCAGFAYGHQFFREEFWSGPLESAQENRFGLALPVFALTKTRKGIDFVIDSNINLVATNSVDFIGLVDAGAIVAARLPRASVLAVDQGRGIAIQAATFLVNHFEAGRVPKFKAAMLTTGKVKPDGRVHIDLKRPLVHEAPFIAQDEEDSPLYVPNARLLGEYVRRHMPADEDLFLVLKFPDDELELRPWFTPEEREVLAGVSPMRLYFDSVQPGEPLPSNGYVSFDGGASFAHVPTLGVDFELIVLPLR